MGICSGWPARHAAPADDDVDPVAGIRPAGRPLKETSQVQEYPPAQVFPVEAACAPASGWTSWKTGRPSRFGHTDRPVGRQRLEQRRRRGSGRGWSRGPSWPHHSSSRRGIWQDQVAKEAKDQRRCLLEARAGHWGRGGGGGVPGDWARLCQPVQSPCQEEETEEEVQSAPGFWTSEFHRGNLHFATEVLNTFGFFFRNYHAKMPAKSSLRFPTQGMPALRGEIRRKVPYWPHRRPLAAAGRTGNRASLSQPSRNKWIASGTNWHHSNCIFPVSTSMAWIFSVSSCGIQCRDINSWSFTELALSMWQDWLQCCFTKNLLNPHRWIGFSRFSAVETQFWL